MAGRLNGKAAVVTGAASGMGKEIALAFLAEGAKVAAVDMNAVRLEELKKEAAEKGFSDSLVTMTGNITKDEDCEAAVKLCVDTFGTCNVLSHNAGVIDDFTPAERITNESWDKVMAVNLTGTMKVCRAALQYFVPNEIKASMVLITSNAAFESATGGPAYCASKAGANAFMKAVAYEYGSKGIRCNSICPGPIASNIQESAPMDKWDKEGMAMHHGRGYNAAQQAWTGYQYVFPNAIAPLAVYLASDESFFMNSNSCVIDGGVCLSR